MPGVIFVLAICAVIVVSIRALLSDLSLITSDIVVIAAIVLTISGWVFWQAHLDGNLDSKDSTIRIGAVAAVATAPALIGIWYGLYSAKRLGEQRSAHRIGMIVMGCAFVAGVLSFGCAILFSMAFVGAVRMHTADRAHFLSCVFWWGLSLLAVPGLLIERECRIVQRKTREMQREERQKKADKRQNS